MTDHESHDCVLLGCLAARTKLRCECGELFPLPTEYGRVNPAGDHQRATGHTTLTSEVEP